MTIQSDPKYRLNTESLNNVFVRTNNGEMAPLGQFVDLTRVYSSEVLNRFNMYSSIAVNGTAADGYSSGDAIRAIQEVATVTTSTASPARRRRQAATRRSSSASVSC